VGSTGISPDYAALDRLSRKDDPVWSARMLRHLVRAVIATHEDLSSTRADNRMSAYVYGDILVLAATAGVYDTAIRSGDALLVVLGTVVSTYVAHVVPTSSERYSAATK
jgi:hypothetical protein